MNRNPGSKQFWRMCGPILLYWVIQYVGRFLTEIIIMIPNMGQFMDYSMFTQDITQKEIMDLALENAEKVMVFLQQYNVQILGIAALFTIPLTVFLFIKDRKQEKLMEIPQNKKAEIWKYAGIIGLGAAVCVGINCLSVMTNLAFASETYQETSAVFYSASVPVQILFLGIVLPVTEELMFRGILFKRYREQGGFLKAALCSALLFSITHGNIVQLIYTFILGMLLAYVYEKYGSFKAPVLLHIVANMVSLILTDTEAFNWIAGSVSRIGIVTIACAFMGSVMFVLIQKIDEKPEGIKPPEDKKITPDMFG